MKVWFVNYKINFLSILIFSSAAFGMAPATCETKDVVISFEPERETKDVGSVGVDNAEQALLALQAQSILGLRRGKSLSGRDAQVNKAILLLAKAADQKNKNDDKKNRLQAAQLKQEARDRKQDRKYACCFNCLTLSASLASTGVAIWAAVLASSKEKTA